MYVQPDTEDRAQVRNKVLEGELGNVCVLNRPVFRCLHRYIIAMETYM